MNKNIIRYKCPERLKPLVNEKSPIENYTEQKKRIQREKEKRIQQEQIIKDLNPKVVEEILREEIEKCLK